MASLIGPRCNVKSVLSGYRDLACGRFNNDLALAPSGAAAYIRPMLGWILVVIGLLLVAALVARIRLYGRLLSDAHFLAIGHGAPALRQGALGQIILAEGNAIQSATDPRILKTDVGLAVVYTISRHESDFVHHCSVSLPGHRVAHGMLEFLLSFVVQLLQLPLVKVRFGVGAGNVHHAQANLSEAEHAALVALPAPDTSAASLFAVRAAAVAARQPR